MWALLFLWVASGWASPSVAVGRFVNHTNDEELAPLGRALADMLVTDLAALSGVTLVERARLDDILAELELNQTTLVDPKRAVEVGRLVGATHMVVGLLVSSDPVLRIDARVIDVSRRDIVSSATVEGTKEEFFLLEKELATELAGLLDVKVTAREQAKMMSRVPTESLEATLAWARGTGCARPR